MVKEALEQREAFIANRILIESELADMARRRGQLIEARRHEEVVGKCMDDLRKIREELENLS